MFDCLLPFLIMKLSKIDPYILFI